jgi:hypothetical protein
VKREENTHKTLSTRDHGVSLDTSTFGETLSTCDWHIHWTCPCLAGVRISVGGRQLAGGGTMAGAWQQRREHAPENMNTHGDAWERICRVKSCRS